jgi:hypothetical protein
MKLPRLALAVLALSTAACGDSDDPVTPTEGDELTAAEAAVLAGIFTGEALGSAQQQLPGAGAQGPATAPTPFDVDVSFNVPCPLGGSVDYRGSMSGEVDAEAGNMAVSVSTSQVHAACGVDVEGVTVFVTGAPGLDFSADIAAQGDPPQGSLSATWSGGFSWEASDGRSGTCGVNLSAAQDLTVGTGSVSGTFCGASIDVSIG